MTIHDINSGRSPVSPYTLSTSSGYQNEATGSVMKAEVSQKEDDTDTALAAQSEHHGDSELPNSNSNRAVTVQTEDAHLLELTGYSHQE